MSANFGNNDISTSGTITGGYFIPSNSASSIHAASPGGGIAVYSPLEITLDTFDSFTTSVITNLVCTSYLSSRPAVNINPDAFNIDFTVYHDGSTSVPLFHCDADLERVGINTISPQYALDVVGSGHFDALNINSQYTFPTGVGSVGDSLVYAGSNQVAWSGISLSGQLDGNFDLNGHDIVGTGNIIISGDITAQSGYFDTISFNIDNESILTKGQISWDDTEGTMDIGLTDNTSIHIGSHKYFRIRNSTGDTLYKGQAVYATGVHENGIIEPDKYVADGTIREVYFMGLMLEDVSNNSNGYAIDFGHLEGMDLDGSASNFAVGDETWNAGDILYVHPTAAGKLTKIEPKHSISVAIVLDTGNGNGNGRMFVRPTSYGHLDDNHDVNVSGVTDGQFLQYDSTTDYWVPSSSGNFETLLVNGTGVSVSGHLHTSSDISDFSESVDDSVSNLLVGTSGIDISYNDEANTLTVAVDIIDCGEVLAPPDAPTGLSATASNQSLLLTWTAPTYVGSTPITGYTVEYTPSGGSASIVNTNSTSTSYTLTGLTNDTSYTVRVRAINSAGSGAYSSSISSTPNSIAFTVSGISTNGTGTTADPYTFTGDLRTTLVTFSINQNGTLTIQGLAPCPDCSDPQVGFNPNSYSSGGIRSISVTAGQTITTGSNLLAEAGQRSYRVWLS